MTLHVGLIGTGEIAERFLAPALSRAHGARLYSVLSRDRERAEQFALRHGAIARERAHEDLAHFLADPELHAVLVATPDALHAAQCLAALRAGKHVLVEKPMATAPSDARAMVALADEKNLRLGVAYHLRWHAGHRALIERVRAGALGEVRHVRVQWTWKSPDASNWRTGDDLGRWWALAAMGTHALDLARWALVPSAGEVVEVRCVRSNAVHKGPHEETAVVALGFARGATAEVTVSTVFRSAPRWEIYGSDGAAIAEATLGPRGTGSITLLDAPFAFEPRDPYQGELEDFARAVREGTDPEVPGREGARNVEILAEAAPTSL